MTSATPKPSAGEHVPRFPVGGSKSAVYNFLRDRGFVMTHWSDKHWTRADGLHLHIYGTGSRARIYGKDDSLLADDALDAAVVLVALPSANGR